MLGKVFEHWTPLDRVNDKGYARYLCKCSCGIEKIVAARYLLNGTSKSCGHVKKDYKGNAEAMRKELKKHSIENTNALLFDQKVAKNNKTGVKGVHKTKDGRYRAYISFNGKREYLGFFDTLEEAREVRKEAEERLYKPFLEKYDK